MIILLEMMYRILNWFSFKVIALDGCQIELRSRVQRRLYLLRDGIAFDKNDMPYKVR